MNPREREIVQSQRVAIRRSARVLAVDCFVLVVLGGLVLALVAQVLAP